MKDDQTGIPTDEEIARWLSLKPEDLPQEPKRTRSRVADMMRWRRSPDFANVRARLFPRTSEQPGDLIVLLSDLGMPELLGPIVEVMCVLGQYPNVVDTPTGIVNVPTTRVLSKIWQPCRLTRIFHGHASGTTPPPVHLIEVRYLKERFYRVSDGNHRCEAARIRDDESVFAEIEDVAEFKPELWRLTKGGVCCRATEQFHALDPDVRAAARWLGIKSR